MKCCIRKFLCFVSIILFCSCTTTRYIPVEKVSTDTVYKSTIMRDSVWLHDSIYVKETSSGDTIYLNIERWHTKYINKEVHDTCYVAKHDSVPVPYPVTKYVKKNLALWQKLLMWFGGISGLLVIVILYFRLKR